MSVVVIWSSSVSIARRGPAATGARAVLGLLPGSRRPVDPARAVLLRCPDSYNVNGTAMLVSSAPGRIGASFWRIWTSTVLLLQEEVMTAVLIPQKVDPFASCSGSCCESGCDFKTTAAECLVRCGRPEALTRDVVGAVCENSGVSVSPWEPPRPQWTVAAGRGLGLTRWEWSQGPGFAGVVLSVSPWRRRQRVEAGRWPVVGRRCRWCLHPAWFR